MSVNRQDGRRRLGIVHGIGVAAAMLAIGFGAAAVPATATAQLREESPVPLVLAISGLLIGVAAAIGFLRPRRRPVPDRTLAVITGASRAAAIVAGMTAVYGSHRLYDHRSVIILLGDWVWVACASAAAVAGAVTATCLAVAVSGPGMQANTNVPENYSKCHAVTAATITVVVGVLVATLMALEPHGQTVTLATSGDLTVTGTGPVTSLGDVAYRHRLPEHHEKVSVDRAGDGWLVTTDEHITAYSGVDGSRRWSLNRARQPHGSGDVDESVIELRNGSESTVVAALGEISVGIDGYTGRILWASTKPELSVHHRGEWIGWVRLMWRTGRSGAGSSAELVAVDPRAGKIRWRKTVSCDPAFAADSEIVVHTPCGGSSGALAVVELSSGTSNAISVTAPEGVSLTGLRSLGDHLFAAYFGGEGPDDAEKAVVFDAVTGREIDRFDNVVTARETRRAKVKQIVRTRLMRPGMLVWAEGDLERSTLLIRDLAAHQTRRLDVGNIIDVQVRGDARNPSLLVVDRRTITEVNPVTGRVMARKPQVCTGHPYSGIDQVVVASRATVVQCSARQLPFGTEIIGFR